MIITSEYIFLHIPKTGGMSVRTAFKMLNRALSTQKQERIAQLMRFHHGFIDYTKFAAFGTVVPTLAFVRDPVTWYPSWYFWATRHNFDRPLFDAIVKSIGTDDPNEVITALLRIPDDGDLKSDVNLALQNASEQPPINLENFPYVEPYNHMHTYIQERVACGQGHLGWMLGRVDNNGVLPITYGKMENLKVDLLNFMDAHFTVPDPLRERIQNMPPLNARPSEQQITLKRSTIDLIKQKEQNLITRFGY